MRTRMAAALVLAAALILPIFAQDKKQKNDENPIVWGMLAQNTGCVIFKERRKTSGKFWGVAVTTKTFSVLEVIETQGYELKQKKWVEDQNGLNELQRIAMKDKVKFVKIPLKYSREQLEKARTACKEPSVVQ